MSHRWGMLVAVLTLGAGCGKGIEAKDAGSIVADAGLEPDAGISLPDAGSTDAGDPEPVDAGAACDRSTACTVAWSEPPRYPVVVDHHTTFVHTSNAGTFLYVVGGASNSGNTLNAVYNTVRRAKIAADGSLEAWADAGTLPIKLAFHTQAKQGNRVYLLGGLTQDAMGEAANGKTLIGTLDDDGALTWKLGSPISEATLHGTGAILGDKLYLIGGSAAAPKDKVWVSTLGADGVNGLWRLSTAALPQARSHHTAIVHGGQIFLLGGFDTGLYPLEEVLRSDLDAFGVVSGWKVAGILPSAPWTAGASVWGDSVFVIGGGEGGPNDEHFVDRVRRARFFQNNTLQDFVDVAPLPTARSHVHFAPIFDGRIYSVGGRVMPTETSIDRIFVGEFQP